MQTISNSSLESVTGGTGSTSIPGGSPTANTTPVGTGTGTGTGSCGLSGALASLNNAIKGLSSNNNGGNQQMQEMMMLGMCMALRPAAPSVVVYGGGGGGGGWGAHWHSRW